MIQTILAGKLRSLSKRLTKDVKARLEKVIEEQNKDSKAEKAEETQEQQKERYNKYTLERERIKEELFRKRVSLEYFWRNAVHFMKYEKDKFKNQSEEHMQNIKRLIHAGDAFELIDGDNLEFKGLMIDQCIGKNSKERVIVVAVIGPQSSGKSTLMNYAFGA